MPQYCDSYAGLLCTSVWVCVSALYVCVYALLIYGAHFLKLVVKIKLFAKLDKKTEKKRTFICSLVAYRYRYTHYIHYLLYLLFSFCCIFLFYYCSFKT